MELNLLLWVVARVAGLSAFLSLAIALLSGMALRTGVLDFLSNNRAMRSLHEFTSVLWIPLGAVHVMTLVADPTARVGLIDVFVPFHVPYGRLAVALGTISLDLIVVVAAVGWLRRRLRPAVWQWLHRLGYVAFGLLFLHAVLGGTDFSDHVISAATWSVAMVILLLSLARIMWGRLPE